MMIFHFNPEEQTTVAKKYELYVKLETKNGPISLHIGTTDRKEAAQQYAAQDAALNGRELKDYEIRARSGRK